MAEKEKESRVGLKIGEKKNDTQTQKYSQRVKQVNNAMRLLLIGERKGHHEVCVYTYVCVVANSTPLQHIHKESVLRLFEVVVGSTFGEWREKKDGETVTYGHPLWDQCANRLLFYRLLDPEQTGRCNFRELYLPNARDKECERVRTEGGWEEGAS